MRVLELKDVIRLLRSEVERAGGQAGWAKKTGIQRTTINKALNDQGLLTKKIIRELKLRMVFVSKPKSPHSKYPTTLISKPATTNFKIGH
jgi:DNA-binding phage protein